METPIPPLTCVGPVYTKTWLGKRALHMLIISAIFAVAALFVDSVCSSREYLGLLTGDRGSKVEASVSYCFIIEAITLYTLVLVEIAYRKEISIIQYVLIGAALFVFYWLLLSFSELMYFWLAYGIVTIMTVGLIGAFINGITHYTKAVGMSVGILLCEYAVILVLLYIGKLALLIGSLCIFALIALAMYFTLKLKIENDEFVLK